MKILLVEDEHKIANSIKSGLEQEKYIVDVCYEGESGLDLATSENYDVIILDRMIPEVSGDEILNEIRKNDIHTPVLMLTAKGTVDDKVEGFNMGADDYLTKPFAFLELLARVKALSRRPKNKVSSIIIYGDLKLDTQNYEAIRNGKVIELSNKEFALLEFFMRHPEKVYSKDQIITNVWSYESDILPNSVEVYVKHLRDKLGKPEMITTVRGFGYKLKLKK